jgi:hypothetical protein
MDQKKIRTATYAMRLRGSCAGLGLAAGLALLTVPGPACAADDGNSDSTGFYNATFGRLLEGFGLQKGDGSNEIHYKERPPLVLPSSRDLPPPEKAEAAVATPAWPKDPDVKRRKLIEAQEKGRIVSDVREHEQNRLSEAELTPGPKPRGVQSINTGPGRSGATDFGEVLSPSQLGYKGGMLGKMFHGKDEDSAQFTGEPPRTELTAPPPGYQTPSPDQPYGVGQAPPKIENDYMNRPELKR